MRSLSELKLSTASFFHADDRTGRSMAYTTSPAHSRESSGASTTSSPATSTFSTHSHALVSSTSSLNTSPGSPINVTKSALHDLVEDPAEREESWERDDSWDLHRDDLENEPFCICDTPFCEHRDQGLTQSAILPPAFPEWVPGDEALSDGELSLREPPKRSRSGAGARDVNADSITARLSRRWPSITQRWRDQKPTTSLSSPSVRSVRSSRPSSLRVPSIRRSVATTAEPPAVEDVPPMPELDEAGAIIRALSRTRSQETSNPLGIEVPHQAEDPIDRQKLSSTPLLPPVVTETQPTYTEELYSPLQSPTVASIVSTPEATPLSMPGLPTPPLSAKPSVASLGGTYVSHVSHSGAEMPGMMIADENESDPWAIKLGHANFHIAPAPYFPEVCDSRACARLLEDWESARKQYLLQAARISEHYGPTSLTYKLTEQKWAEIDAQWRANLDQANTEAAASGENPVQHILAEVPLLAKIPSLHDPSGPMKFPGVADEHAEIVGPMVQYAPAAPPQSPQHQQHFSSRDATSTPSSPTMIVEGTSSSSSSSSKKPPRGILRLFSDPTSLLGSRSPFATKR